MSKAKKRFLIITPATLLVLCLSLYLAGNHMLSYAMSPVQPELAPDSPLYDHSREKREYENEIDEIANKQMDKDDLWLKSVSTVMSIQSFDNLKLNAYVAKHGMNSPFSQTHNWAIFMHGYRDNPSRMSPYAHHFFDKGFNVVIPGRVERRRLCRYGLLRKHRRHHMGFKNPFTGQRGKDSSVWSFHGCCNCNDEHRP